MSKIINTLKKGTGKAKLVVILAILAGIASLGFIVLAIVFKQLLYFFGTVICAFITISLKQTLDVYEYQGKLYAEPGSDAGELSDGYELPEDKGEDEDNEDDNEDDNEENEDTDVASLLSKMNDLLDAAENPGGEDADVLAEIMSEAGDGEQKEDEEDSDRHKHKHKRHKKERKHKKDRHKNDNGENSDEENSDEENLDEENQAVADADNYDTEEYPIENSDTESEDDDIDENVSDDEDTQSEGKKKRRNHNKKKRTKKAKPAATEEDTEKTPDKGRVQADILEDELERDLNFLKNNISGKSADDKEEEESKKLVVVKPASDEVVATYDKKKIKKTLHKYKVKRDHRLIIIDHCDKYYIKQTPAYIWVSDKEFNILLIEEEPRHLVLPVYGISEITYRKKCPVNADTDYPIFHKKTLLTDTFRPYLPDYTQSTVATDLTSYKNLYGFGPDIYCTNRSAKNLFDLLSVEFRVDDKVTMSNKVNIYFKECYKSGILLRDDVIDANGYADRISRTLDEMAKSTISNNEFKDTLNLLVRNKIITKEFSDHYMDVRNNMARS